MSESTTAQFETVHFETVAPRPPAPSPVGTLHSDVRSRSWRDPLILGIVAMLISAIGSWIPSKWNDEIATQDAASRTLPQLWQMVQHVDAVHAAYYGFMHFWIIAFGTSDFALRAPSMLAVGVATAGVVVLGRKLGSQRIAICSGIVFMVLPRVTWMGMEARSYATTAAVAVWLTILFVHLIDRQRRAFFALYLVLAIAGVTLNIYIALLVIAHGLVFILARRRIRNFRRMFIGWAVAAALVAVLTLPVTLLATSESAQLPFGRLTLDSTANALLIGQYFIGATPTFLRSVPVPPTSLWSLSAIVLASIGWLGMLAPIVVRRLRHRREDTSLSLVLVAAAWIFVPVLLVIGYSLISTPIYTARYFSFTTPAVALLIGTTIAALSQRRAQTVAALGIFALIATPVYLSQRTPISKNGSDYGQVAAIVAHNAKPGQDIYYGMVTLDSQRHLTEIRDGYPAVLSTLHNVTQIKTGVQDATLWGTYRSLANSAAEVRSSPVLWAVLGHDGQPSPKRGSAEAFIESQGLHLDRIWRGHTTDVLMFSRVPLKAS
ncbi:MAG: putative rane protein [Glaciihabitans sp.]|nr:putative rane protein [Glaciihabitans sp.]